MNKLVLQLLRLFLTVILLGYFVIFFGVISQGWIDLRSIFKLTGAIYPIVNIAIGGWICVIVLQRIWRLWQQSLKNLNQQLENRWQIWLLTTFVLLLLFMIRFDFPSLILFAGVLIGDFFLKIARNAYVFLFGVDILEQGFQSFRWVFQWQFIYAVLGLFIRWGNKLQKWLKS